MSSKERNASELINEKKGMKTMKNEKQKVVFSEAKKGIITLKTTRPCDGIQDNPKVYSTFSYLGQPAVLRMDLDSRYGKEKNVHGVCWDIRKEIKHPAYSCDANLYTLGRMGARMLEEACLEELTKLVPDGTNEDGTKRMKKEQYSSIEWLLEDWDVPVLRNFIDDDGVFNSDKPINLIGLQKDLYKILDDSMFSTWYGADVYCDRIGEKDVSKKTKIVKVKDDRNHLYGGELEAVFIYKKEVMKSEEISAEYGFVHRNNSDERKILKNFLEHSFVSYKLKDSLNDVRTEAFDKAKEVRMELLGTGAIQDLLHHFNDEIIKHRGIGFDFGKGGKFEYTGTCEDSYSVAEHDVKVSRSYGDLYTCENVLTDVLAENDCGSLEHCHLQDRLDSSYFEGDPQNCTPDDIVNQWAHRDSLDENFNMSFKLRTRPFTSNSDSYEQEIQVAVAKHEFDSYDSPALKSCGKQGYGFVYRGTSTQTSRSYGSQERFASRIATVKKHITESIEGAFKSYSQDHQDALDRVEEKAQQKVGAERRLKFNKVCGDRLNELLELGGLTQRSPKNDEGLYRNPEVVRLSLNSELVEKKTPATKSKPSTTTFTFEEVEYDRQDKSQYICRIRMVEQDWFWKVDSLKELPKMDCNNVVVELCDFNYYFGGTCDEDTSTITCHYSRIKDAIQNLIWTRNEVRTAFEEYKKVANKSAETYTMGEIVKAKKINNKTKHFIIEEPKDDNNGVIDRPQRRSQGMSDYALENPDEPIECGDCDGEGKKMQEGGYSLICSSCEGDGYHA